MVELMLDFMLGSVGRPISDFYLEHQVTLNSIVVGCGLFGVLYKRKHNPKEETANQKE